MNYSLRDNNGDMHINVALSRMLLVVNIKWLKNGAHKRIIVKVPSTIIVFRSSRFRKISRKKPKLSIVHYDILARLCERVT